MANTINIGVKLDYGTVVFKLRMISSAEDSRYLKRFLEIKPGETDERKSELEYEIYVDVLADWVAAPVAVIDEKNVERPFAPAAETPAASVREFFKEFNPRTERIAPAVIGNYRNKLQPEVVFL